MRPASTSACARRGPTGVSTTTNKTRHNNRHNRRGPARVRRRRREVSHSTNRWRRTLRGRKPRRALWLPSKSSSRATPAVGGGGGAAATATAAAAIVVVVLLGVLDVVVVVFGASVKSQRSTVAPSKLADWSEAPRKSQCLIVRPEKSWFCRDHAEITPRPRIITIRETIRRDTAEIAPASPPRRIDTR